MVDAKNCMAVKSCTLVNKGCSVFDKPKDSFKAC